MIQGELGEGKNMIKIQFDTFYKRNQKDKYPMFYFICGYWFLILEMCVSFRIYTEVRQLVKTGDSGGVLPRKGNKGETRKGVLNGRGQEGPGYKKDYGEQELRLKAFWNIMQQPNPVETS